MHHAHAPGTQRPRRRRHIDWELQPHPPEREEIVLWYAKRWAEYLTFLATTLLLPLEIYEIINQGTVLKVIGFVINLAAVVHLLLKKRLFGLHGGAAAEEAERAADGGWPAIERATPGAPEPVQTWAEQT